MSNNEVKSTFIQNLLDIFKETFGDSGYFKSYFYGDPIAVNDNMLPALIIDETNVQYIAGPTTMDNVQHDVLIQVVLNKKDELGKPKTEAPMSRKLAEIIHGRDPQTSRLLPKTILNVLRSSITLDGVSVHQEVNVDFGVVGRPGGVVTAEGHVKVTIMELMYVNRTS